MRVSEQVTDSVTHVNVENLGMSPSVAAGNLYQATAQSLANVAHQATNGLQQTFITTLAATTQGVATLYGIETAATATAEQKIFKG